MFELTKMHGAFGAFIDGVDLGGPLDAVAIRALIDALYENHILVVRNQELGNEEYVRFGRYWGEPILFFDPRHRDAAFPEIIKIHNSPSTPERQRDVALHWHADSSYEEIPASVTMLYAIEAPSVGNETLFADMSAAYAALPTTMKTRVDNLVVEHPVTGGRVFSAGEKRGSGGDNEHTKTLKPARQPLVLAHPGTGRKALYAVSGSADGIVGMPQDEAIGLLLELKQHATQPQFVQRARALPGAILIWDNFAVMHSATPTIYSDADGSRRLLHRISTRGLPSVLGRQLEWSVK